MIFQDVKLIRMGRTVRHVLKMTTVKCVTSPTGIVTSVRVATWDQAAAQVTLKFW
jgi:hypothetical protein